MLHLANYFAQKENNAVKCLLCPHACFLKPKEAGLCRMRVNRDGKLYTKNYGVISAINVDPIEKKPLYHFYPGRGILSLGTIGCNLHCEFCQNYRIAHQVEGGRSTGIEKILAIAESYHASKASIGIAYTYSEPGVWFEFIKDLAPRIKEKGMVNVLVTNGYLNKKPFRELLNDVDALNIDIKAFTESFYRTYVRGTLKPVLESCIAAKEAGKHLEVTALLIPGLNDGEAQVRELSKWLATLDERIPLHISRYFPSYKMEVEQTPPKTMERAWEIAKEHLKHVFIGNAPSLDRADTFCPSCGELLIKRDSYRMGVFLEEANKCPGCQTVLAEIVNCV